MIVERQVQFAAVPLNFLWSRMTELFIFFLLEFLLFFSAEKIGIVIFKMSQKKYFNFRQKIFKSIITALHGYVTRIELHGVLCTPFLAKKNKSIN